MLDMENIEELENKPKGYPKGELYIHTAPSLVEEVGHWYPWTHEIEQNQKGLHKSTYRKEIPPKRG